MIQLMPQLYSLWRQERFPQVAFQETTSHLIPPEYLLQAVWHHQRLLHSQLRTLDGHTLRILHPGFANRESGPDFKSAVIQFGGNPACSGDVEIDLYSHNWHSHRHDINDAFNSVILHVIWSHPPNHHPPIKTLVLKEVLDAPIAELSQWLDTKDAHEWPENLAGKCQQEWQKWDLNAVKELLGQAAQVRMQAKANQFEARARQAGWEQALWEGLFRALGYKNNCWPMQRVAEALPSWLSQNQLRMTPLLEWQARLFGLAGVLPGEINQFSPDTQRYLILLWDYWWREINEYSSWIVPASLWQMHGQRPANHPQRRLALAAHWLSAGNLCQKLEKWMTSTAALSEPVESLLETLDLAQDEYWNHHWTFRSERQEISQPLLGAARVTELAVNAILPWLWSRAVAGKNSLIQNRVEKIYMTWPPSENNAVLRLATNRLFGRDIKLKQIGAATQQGVIQIVRDFCNHANACCDQCQLPGFIVKSDQYSQKGE